MFSALKDAKDHLMQRPRRRKNLDKFRKRQVSELVGWRLRALDSEHRPRFLNGVVGPADHLAV